MNILVVSAHPDDEIIGMGGTLKKLSKKHNISVLFLAEGITERKKSGHVSVPNYEVDNIEKKKMQREGLYREMKLRKHYEKPSLRRAREKAESIRRFRKMQRRKMDGDS